MAAVEDQLGAGDRHRERDEAGPVELHRAARRVVAQREPDADQRAEAGRDDDEEGGAPVVGFGRDAAQDRPEHGAEHRANAPNHDGGGLQMLREGREQDGLAKRHDRRAERALRHARQDQRLQAAGEAAQQRGDGEAEHGEEHQVAPAQPARQPARHRRGDGGGHQVERDHPGDLVLRRRQVAAHLRQHQVGDGDGHAEQHVGELDHQQDEPLPPADREQAALVLSDDGRHSPGSSLFLAWMISAGRRRMTGQTRAALQQFVDVLPERGPPGPLIVFAGSAPLQRRVFVVANTA